jgi:hypothetical protein
MADKKKPAAEGAPAKEPKAEKPAKKKAAPAEAPPPEAAAAPPAPAPKPQTPPRNVKIPKLAKKNKSRLPRRQKKALMKANAAQHK